MAADAGFSLKEAAVLADISEKSIRHELACEIATPEGVPDLAFEPEGLRLEATFPLS